jgi:hypothetical protein
MPRNPRRRRSTARRSLPPRPTYKDAPEALADEAKPRPVRRRAADRQAVTVAREAPYLGAELRRIVGVSAACAGLLAVLVVVDRI